MLLEDAKSREQVHAALEAGDEELRADIEEKLDDAKRHWEESDRGYDEFDEPIDMKEVVDRDDFIDHVILKSPSRYELSESSGIPRDHVKEELQSAASRPSDTRRRAFRSAQTKYGPFYLDERGGDHFTYKMEVGGNYTFRGSLFPKNADFIPTDIAQAFWESLSSRHAKFDWDHTAFVSGDDDNWGSGPGTEVFVQASEEDFDEWCRDVVSSYVQQIVKASPEKAKKIFFAALGDADATLAMKLEKAGLPDEEILDFAVSWFEDESEQSNIVETIREYFDALESGATVDREVIAEFSKEDIVNMGIKKGVLFENAPWKLIKLHPSDLRLEGTLMGHCVGKADMGYIKAVKAGEIEIWSLRSRDNKPRFTLEVDSEEFYAENIAERAQRAGETEDAWRGAAIKQLKGKANRGAGYADTRMTGGVKFPDEVIFWTHALPAIGADPEHVDDLDPTVPQALNEYREHGAFGHAPPVQRNDGEVCTGFDLPYRPRAVRQNRRSSKRRGSKRRSSKRKTSRRRSSRM